MKRKATTSSFEAGMQQYNELRAKYPAVFWVMTKVPQSQRDSVMKMLRVISHRPNNSPGLTARALIATGKDLIALSDEAVRLSGLVVTQADKDAAKDRADSLASVALDDDAWQRLLAARETYNKMQVGGLKHCLVPKDTPDETLVQFLRKKAAEYRYPGAIAFEFDTDDEKLFVYTRYVAFVYRNLETQIASDPTPSFVRGSAYPYRAFQPR
jgi:hypothetical protein